MNSTDERNEVTSLVLPIEAVHREALVRLLSCTVEFTREEVAIATELVDLAIKGSVDYRALVCVEGGRHVTGYVCFGPTPMTDGTFDLYWIAVAPHRMGRGTGRRLVEALEAQLRDEGARLVRVETAGLDSYDLTRKFYERLGYDVVAKIRDFYAVGNDLYIYGHYLK